MAQLTKEQQSEVLKKYEAGELSAEQAAHFEKNYLPKMEMGEAIVRGAAQGLTFNLADELAALTKSAVGGDYAQEIEKERKLYKKASEDRPISYLGGAVAGSIPSAVAAGALLPGRLIAQGAALGGLSGFGSGEGESERLVQSMAGAGLGGTFGAGAKTLGRIMRPAEQKGAEKASKELSDIVESLGDDVTDVPLMYQSPKAASRAEAIATREGVGGEKISKAVSENLLGKGDEVRSALSKNFPQENIAQLKESLVRKAYEQAAPKYEEAYGITGAIDDIEINKILSNLRDVGELDDIIKTASKASKLRGQPFDEKQLGVRELDQIARAIRDKAISYEGTGAFGGKTRSSYGGALSGVSDALNKRLLQLSPELASARAGFADDVAVAKAYDFGLSANIFGKNAENIALDYSKLPENAKEAARLGLGKQFETMVNNNPMAALKRFNSDQFKKSVRPFFSNEEEYVALIDDLTQKAKEVAVNAKVVQGSPTARRMMQQSEDAAKNNILNDLISTMSPRQAAIKGAQRVLENSLTNSKSRKAADEILAELLTRPMSRTAAQEEAFKLLMQSGKQKQDAVLPLAISRGLTAEKGE